MCKNKPSLPSIKRIKQRAKSLKRNFGIKQSQALDLVANENGFSFWLDLKKALDEQDVLEKPIPAPSLNFVEDEDISMTDIDYSAFDQERSHDLDEGIKLLIERNKRQLAKLGIEFSVFEPTLTGLKKSILDATHSLRTHFELENFHYYWDQGQGPEYKVIKESVLLTSTKEISTTASLYRPKTKKGDPRIWFRKLSELAKAGDQVAIIIENNQAYLVNISTNDLQKLIEKNKCPISIFFNKYTENHNSVSIELLTKLRTLAVAPFPAQRKGDTGIGYTIETLLNIKANSSKLPDYKGIEIKSGRGNGSRTTLFAQVADWSISPCKRSVEILNKYGYERSDDFKLYCTISTQRENSQGLIFIYDRDKDELQEWHGKNELVAVWPGSLLRARLKEKHAETFWIEAQSNIVDGIEQFQLISVTHTRSPIISQLLPLIESGVVTMDHLIKRNGRTNRVSEKGPLFKINKRDLELLFPTPITYSLIEDK